MKIIISIIFLSITGIAALFIFFNYILQRIFHLPHVPNTKTPKDFELKYEDVLIPTVHGKKIQIWDLNPQKKAPVIIGVHGWANTSDKLLPVAKYLVRKWRVFLLNTRNHGGSDDDSYTTIIKYKDDLFKTIDYVIQKTGSPIDIILLGHSLGGAAVLYAAAKDARIKGVISISSFADMEEVMRAGFFKGKFPRAFTRSMLTYIEFRIGENLKRLSPLFTINKFKSPALIIHGTKDETVDFENMNRIVKSATRKNVHQLIMKDHSHSSLLEETQLAVEIDRFLSTYFSDKKQTPPIPNEGFTNEELEKN